MTPHDHDISAIKRKFYTFFNPSRVRIRPIKMAGKVAITPALDFK